MDSNATPQYSHAISIPQRTDRDLFIPGDRRRATRRSDNDVSAGTWDSGSSMPSASDSWSSRTWDDKMTPGRGGAVEQSSNSTRKDKQKAIDTSSPSSPPSLLRTPSSPLGPSMLSSTSYKSVNLNSHGDPDEPPRLITYTKYSQGFVWNDEVFLPSYLLGRYGGRSMGGRKKQYDDDFGDEDHCPIAEIFVTDEEAKAMMP